MRNMQILETYPQHGRSAQFQQTVLFHPDEQGVENEVVNLYPEVTYEHLEGFGGAITDSAGFVYHQMNEEQKEQVISTYFSEEEMNYRLVRIPMDSCDFSVDQYAAVNDPEDHDLTGFSFARTEKYILPMLEDANRAAKGQLKLMLSPWSPPAWMKTNGERSHGGSLKPEYRVLYAEYLCRYIRQFQERGYRVERLSIQNEPKAVQPWDSCIYTAEDEKVFLRDYLAPAMKHHHMEDIEVFIWDHNKERIYERVRDILAADTADLVTGAAFHWYSGEHFDALRLIREKYPDIKLILSESCLEYSKFGSDGVENKASRLSHEIIGDLNAGMSAFYDWNLLLDEQGGPNHSGNFCHAPFLFDTKRQVLLPQYTQKHFYHFSHFLREMDQRIAVSKYTDSLDVTAYQTAEGCLTVILLNKSKESLPVNLRLNGEVAELMLMPEAILTARIEGAC